MDNVALGAMGGETSIFTSKWLKCPTPGDPVSEAEYSDFARGEETEDDPKIAAILQRMNCSRPIWKREMFQDRLGTDIRRLLTVAFWRCLLRS